MKIKSWIKRYLPAEILGTISAVLVPTLFAVFSDSPWLIAFSGTIGENIGFYGAMIVQEVFQNKKKYHKEGRRYGWRGFLKSVRNIFIEFGVAETFDSLFLRPAAMYFGVSIFDNLQLGIFFGKILADVVFYIPAIISYELRKKHFRD